MKILDQEKTRANIVALRNERGLSQNQLAETLGASRTHYNGIENGKATITEKYVITLAGFYGVDYNDIAVYAESYDGFKAVFELDLDKSKADPKAAAELMSQF